MLIESKIRAHISSRSMDVMSIRYEIPCNKGKVPNEVRKTFSFCLSRSTQRFDILYYYAFLNKFAVSNLRKLLLDSDNYLTKYT